YAGFCAPFTYALDGANWGSFFRLNTNAGGTASMTLSPRSAGKKDGKAVESYTITSTMQKQNEIWISTTTAPITISNDGRIVVSSGPVTTVETYSVTVQANYPNSPHPTDPTPLKLTIEIHPPTSSVAKVASPPQ
ncbi:MAG: hypothetical protein KGQ59_00600, partial [Bdellovibrionales bacterium]|nr:hypothetical protein [Bdellovibrionales bacterium]